MRQSKPFRRLRHPFTKFLGGALFATLMLPMAMPQASAQSTDDAKKDALTGYNIATVNYTQLLRAHKSFDKLMAVDQEIAYLHQEKERIEAEAREILIKEGGATMETALEKAKAKLKKEQEAVQSELRALSNRLAGQIESEMRGLQASYQREIEAEIAKFKPKPQSVEAPALDAGLEGQVKDYMDNLILVRQRNLAAKRLELEKRVGDAISAKKAEVDGQISAYESDLAAQYQSERLNLQLTTQNTSDEDAKKAAYKRLEEISREIDGLKQAKRAELEGGYNAVRSEQTQILQSELSAYQATLDREVQQKVAAKRSELGHSMPRAAVANDPGAEIKGKIDAVKARMQGQLHAKQAALKARMNAETDEARKRLEAKQKEVEIELQKIEEEISAKIKEGMENLPDEVKAKIASKEKEIENLEKNRKALFEGITASLNNKVGEIAKGMEDQKIDMVVGITEFEYSTYPDLSDRALAGVSSLKEVSVTTPTASSTPEAQ